MAYTREYPINVSYGGSSIKECIVNNDKDIKNLYELFSKQIGLSGSANGSRQCVLTGKFNADGEIGFLTPQRFQDTPYVGISCEDIPAILVFANGFTETGARDIVKRLDAHDNTAWKLKDDTLSYLYIDCSLSTGDITFGVSSFKDTYSYKAPEYPQKDQCWFDRGAGIMKCYDGAAWQKVLRIFIASVTTKAGCLPAVHPYSAVSRLTASDDFQLDDDGSVSFRDGGELRALKAAKFIGTADKALAIPVGRCEGANIWIEEVMQ